MRALGIGPGDEVILPSFTMTSTANCVVLTGATPVFADIKEDSYNVDPESIAEKITAKTRGIIVVHYAGMSCDMVQIASLAKRHRLFIVEDAAHAIGATYRGKQLGTLSAIGAFSFHGTKNISCGEGGAALTDDPKLADKMDIFRANGTNRSAFLAGMVSRYSWVGTGSSFFLSDLLAAVACAQLTRIRSIIRQRAAIAAYYSQALSRYRGVIALPKVTPGTSPNWHIYAIRFTSPEKRSEFMKGMRVLGIEVSSHYVPLHTSVMGLAIHARPAKLPVTDRVANTLVRLPIYPGLTAAQLRYIVTSAQKVLEAH